MGCLCQKKICLKILFPAFADKSRLFALSPFWVQAVKTIWQRRLLEGGKMARLCTCAPLQAWEKRLKLKAGFAAQHERQLQQGGFLNEDNDMRQGRKRQEHGERSAGKSTQIQGPGGDGGGC
jgi:hypothetical protein